MNGYDPNFLTALSSANVLTDNMCIVWANSNFLITFLHNYILFTLHRHSAQSMSNVLSVIQKRGWYESLMWPKRQSANMYLFLWEALIYRIISISVFGSASVGGEGLFDNKHDDLYVQSNKKAIFFLRFVLPTY